MLPRRAIGVRYPTCTLHDRSLSRRRRRRVGNAAPVVAVLLPPTLSSSSSWRMLLRLDEREYICLLLAIAAAEALVTCDDLDINGSLRSTDVARDGRRDLVVPTCSLCDNRSTLFFLPVVNELCRLAVELLCLLEDNDLIRPRTSSGDSESAEALEFLPLPCWDCPRPLKLDVSLLRLRGTLFWYLAGPTLELLERERDSEQVGSSSFLLARCASLVERRGTRFVRSLFAPSCPAAPSVDVDVDPSPLLDRLVKLVASVGVVPNESPKL
mmetsp:Transcript_3997/g.9815  ORF Transcript_3997/g.9815 Transcript_3997/m.9815 type:complete len:269 (-) Transcript_3997:1137-1943(-)